ncbi:MBL fold metallo-hydrolase RNA specificity domain-containing protein [Streptomyces sp. NPDC002814]
MPPRSQIIDWLRKAHSPHTTYLVHGEPDTASALRDRINRTLGWTAVVPRSGEHVLVRQGRDRRRASVGKGPSGGCPEIGGLRFARSPGAPVHLHPLHGRRLLDEVRGLPAPRIRQPCR